MIPAGSAAAITCAALALAAWTNHRLFGWLPDDLPGPARKGHLRPIPLAGIVAAAAVIPWLIEARDWWALGGFTLAAAVGFVDDWRKEKGQGLDWRWKTIALAFASASGAIAVGWPSPEPLTWVALGAFLWALTNATNFLDNTDGAAASVAAASLLVSSGGEGWLAAAGFAAIGFLPWNWPRPRLFLGDAGAYALGFATGIAVARGARVDYGCLWAVAVQLLDFIQVLVARVAIGVPPWIGDRRHLTHIAQNLGLPRVLVAPCFAALVVGLAHLK